MSEATAMFPTGEFRYLLKTTGHSSEKYGNCEICGKHASEVFYQSIEEFCAWDDESGWVHRSSSFGHAECLMDKRVRPAPTPLPTQEGGA